MILVVNCGSSSVKHRLVEPDQGTSGPAGLVERIGQPGGPPDHAAALEEALKGVEASRLRAVAHRVVHGGERFVRPVLVDDAVLAAIRELAVLAPLHNPVNALGIETARRLLPRLPHVAVFDTAFHATLPPAAHTYAVPEEWGVRRYGFHGTSHAYVARRAAELLGRPAAEVNVIVLHLGNGASAAAVAGGRSVETSMGLTPLEGLVMGSRSGDVDPAVVFHLHRRGMSVEEIETGLNRRSGMLALAGDGDLRAVHRRIAAGDRRAAMALDVYCHRIRKYVGAYAAVLGRVDAIAFTAGVGEHDATVRARSLAGLERFGIAVDHGRNVAGDTRIAEDGAPVSIFVIPTDEELEMATQALAVIGGGATR